jgi:D-aminoacyl-tRNA deacylase
MASKIVTILIFSNGDKHFDLDVKQSGGSILLVSNFTVAGDARKGRRPSLDAAAAPEVASPMFDRFVQLVREQGVDVQTGKFGADMLVHIVNDGPVTFILDSRKSR